jgi:hypothetical protein
MKPPSCMLSRRAMTIVAATLMSPTIPPQPADAESFSLTSLPVGSRAREMIEASMRPKIRALPRRRLEQDFAVLLMRTSYAVADELDFMPMDEFQKEQFLFRQREWDTYREKLPVMQGDLTDPAYFDFISFCQYASIASGMRRGRMIFEELIDANGTSVIVSRAPTLPQRNELLPEAHSIRVGDRLLNWMLERYDGVLRPVIPPTSSALPRAPVLVEGCQRVADIFTLNEFALTSTVTPLASGAGVAWTLVAPATLWGAQVLQLRGDEPKNDFEVMAVLAYLRRCGVPATSITRFEKGGTQVTHEIRWAPGFVVAA